VTNVLLGVAYPCTEVEVVNPLQEVSKRAQKGLKSCTFGSKNVHKCTKGAFVTRMGGKNYNSWCRKGVV